MTLQASGAISLSEIQTEFTGSNPISLSEYYRSGSYVPNVGQNSNIPTSGQISFSNFYSGQRSFAISRSIWSSDRYFAASGYSLDCCDGSVYLTLGAMSGGGESYRGDRSGWTSADMSSKLMFRGRGPDNAEGNDDGQNYRGDNNILPKWGMWQSIDVIALSISQNFDMGAYSSPQGGFYASGNVAYTYRITKISSNSVEVRTYPSAWGTGDTGNDITVSNWWNGFNNATGNNTEANGYLGWFTLTW